MKERAQVPEWSFSEKNPGPLRRFLEIMPGALSWSFILLPIVLGFLAPVAAAYIIIGYTIYWLFRIIGLSYRMLVGFYYLRSFEYLDWQARLEDIQDIEGSLERINKRITGKRIASPKRRALKRYRKYLKQAQENQDQLYDPREIEHVIIMATYNEALSIIEPAVKALTEADFDQQKMIFALGYEERGGEQTEKNAKYLIDKYGDAFQKAWAIKHPADIPGEVKGKAGNITYAAKKVTEYVKEQGKDPTKIMVTTLDADHQPGRNYFAYLSYLYAITPNRVHTSYQPVPMFFNNIWETSAPMRVQAANNSFFILMESLRPHRLRLFSAHAQSLQTVLDSNYWNVKSIVEDGHQYWRTFFAYDGDHQVEPIFAPIYQDAVLAKTYWRTFKVQFYQLRRWSWGVSDTPYLIINSFRDKKIPWSTKFNKIFQQIEGYFSWATAPIVLAFAAWAPLLLNPQFNEHILAHQLPVITSRVQTVALLGLIAPILASVLSLPPRPSHRGTGRSVMMVLQWALLPVTLIGFVAFSALNSQTRLMFGRYLEKFEVTEKAESPRQQVSTIEARKRQSNQEAS